MSSVTQAIEKRDSSPIGLVQQYKNEFALVLPSHVKPDVFTRLAVGALRRNPDLAKAAEKKPAALMSALLDCARLGLEVGDTYHLAVFGGEITGIVDYTGEIELIYRAGAVSSVKAEVVYSNDRFHYRPDMERPEHDVDWFGDRGEMVGAYAYAVMKGGGTSRVVVYSRAQIEQVRAVSRAAAIPGSIWQKWPDRMWLKTVVHALAKWVPSSAEYQREQLRAVRDVATETPTVLSAHPPLPQQHVDDTTGEITDAVIVDEMGEPA